MTWLAVALGAGIGAPLRYLVEVAVVARGRRAGRTTSRAGFPWALLVVNVAGSALAGVVASVSPMARAGVLVGFCGALTTYSGFGAHLDLQWRENRRGFWTSLVVMPVACIAALVVTLLLTRAATGS